MTRSPDSFVYVYEPLGFNIERLRQNLARFEGRYKLHPIAVGTTNGTVEFGWEETGRYGGVGMKTGNYISVPCVDSNTVLGEAIAKHGGIDILKIDIETMERELTERIPFEFAKHIQRIYVEKSFDPNPLGRTHDYRQYGSVAQFTLRGGN
ncbi:FkbM family methyltransferase [Mesorhizobium sp. M0293]